MRNKIDYGIDLGTTNSAIARMENGEPTIKKSELQKDTIPSCVHFNQKKSILVGDTAFNAIGRERVKALSSSETISSNSYTEFKRTMGTTHSYESSNMGRSFSSEELSAEVLKKLKSLVTDENVNSIIITVPAKFINTQNEATIKAAKMAGFKQAQLLQEPVAAATAYGLSNSKKDGYWCVFDFGGGTFDAALIKAEEGILSIKDTDGDNWLGGKNLDEAIVDNIILPYLAENYEVINGLMTDTNKKEILRSALKVFAEEAKIQLSFNNTHNIMTPLGDLQVKDENGKQHDLELDITVTQSDMERILSPVFQKAIDITKHLLERNNLKGSNLEALILVGGPTYSPILRRMLKEQITEKVDTSVDPMTVVARGAALFASTVSVTDNIQEESRDKTKIQLDVKYYATSVELNETVNIKILKEKTEGNLPAKVYGVISRFDGAWTSGKKEIGTVPELIEVELIEGRSNLFTVTLYDDMGNKLECEPNEFSILQGIGGLDSMQVLPYHIGIVKHFDDEDKDLFSPVKGLEKNKRIPATGTTNGLKTRQDIKPGMKDVFRIPIYQGDYNAERTNPALNNLIKEIVVSGEELPSFLPKGSDVDITIKIDSSQTMFFRAYIPLLDYDIKMEIKIKQIEPPSEHELREKIGEAKKRAIKSRATEIEKNLNNLLLQLENEKGNVDGRLKILDAYKKELLKLDEQEKRGAWPKVEEDLRYAFGRLERTLSKYKNESFRDESIPQKIDTTINEYRTRVDDMIRGKNIKSAKELISQLYGDIHQILFDILGDELFVQYLRGINNTFESRKWTDKAKAKQLINEGLQRAALGDVSVARDIFIQVMELLPEEEQKSRETLE